jgi:hypothetical protein
MEPDDDDDFSNEQLDFFNDLEADLEDEFEDDELLEDDDEFLDEDEYE